MDVTDVAALPDMYIRRKESVEPDKIVLKEALKCGLEIPGATLVKNFQLADQIEHPLHLHPTRPPALGTVGVNCGVTIIVHKRRE